MSDSEFEIVVVVDGGEVEIEGEDREEEVEEVRKKGRGADLVLEEYASFEKPEVFKASDIFKEIKELMTKKKDWKTMEARKQQYVCKYSQRRGYKMCRRQYMVAYSNKSLQIVVFHTPEDHHIHEKDPDYCTKENYSWNSKQEAIVVQGIKNNVKNSLILRQLKESGAVNGSGQYPTLRQVGVKK